MEKKTFFGWSLNILQILSIIVAIVFSVYYYFKPAQNSAKIKNNFELINPTVTADIGKHFIINFKPLKEKFLATQAKFKEKTNIYFVYMNNAAWVGLGEKELFHAASTIKIPMAMAILKAVEEGKLSLENKYGLEELDLNPDFGELYKIGADKEFSISELLKIMLEKSDNTATLGLANVLRRIGLNDPFYEVYKFMGWEYNDLGQNPNYLNINPKTLSNMFLALYNARYVNMEHSELILKHLDNSDFNSKISAGVPKDIPVSHKEGISDDAKTYSDCGIVYAPNRHYIICVSFEGDNEQQANKFISEISKSTYDYVIKN